MVCLGNICRSPMAQGILEKKLEAKGISDVHVDSAGTSDYHIDEEPDPRAQNKTKEYNIDISHLRGRQFLPEDFDTFDYIFAMDDSNYDNIVKLARDGNDQDKVEMILNLSFPGENLPVPDPYFGAEDGFEKVYQLLDQACEVLVKRLENESR